MAPYWFDLMGTLSGGLRWGRRLMAFVQRISLEQQSNCAQRSQPCIMCTSIERFWLSGRHMCP